MRSYKDSPEEGSLVVIEIQDINPHSVFAQLEEFPEKEGLIHISEIARSWVRDIRKHVSKGEKTVAQVLGQEEDDSDTISLSLKRVNDKQKSDKMKEWNKERKADKFVQKVADEVGKDFDDVYEDVAFSFQREFGNTFDGFEEALVDQDRIQGIIDEEYADAVIDVAEDNISLKQVKLEGDLKVSIPTGDGLKKIKDAFRVGEGVEVSYISAPRYKVQVWGRNQEQAKKRMDATVESIQDKVEATGGTFSFERA